MNKRFLAFAILLVFAACGIGVDKKELERDAESLALHRCQLKAINNKISMVTKHMGEIEDSLKMTNLNDTIKRRLVFYKAKRRDESDYYAEVIKGYIKNNAEEEADYKKDKYQRAVAWKKLNERAEQLLKIRNDKNECDIH